MSQLPTYMIVFKSASSDVVVDTAQRIIGEAMGHVGGHFRLSAQETPNFEPAQRFDEALFVDT